MTAWISEHLLALRAALLRLLRAPLGNLLTLLALGVALSLPVGLLAIIENLQAGAKHISPEPRLSLYMDASATRDDAQQVGARLKADAGVQTYAFMPREQALKDLKDGSGLADVIDTLPDNPLPDAYIVQAKDARPTALAALRDKLKAWPHVGEVQVDAAWARRLDAGLRVGRLIVAMLAGLLALALLAITFNTVRLQVLTQREEIEVAKLIGATNTFIRRPFLYFGALQGALGALAAWGIVAGAVWLLNRNLGELSQVYASLFELRYPSWDLVGGLIVGAVAVNWFGAVLSVERHLAMIEPGRG
jgi:cell division transport system permease protein